MQEPIMIALDQDDLTVQAFNQRRSIVVAGLPDHITQHIHKITLVDLVVLSADQLRIHFLDRCKWPSIECEYILMTKMQVTCE